MLLAGQLKGVMLLMGAVVMLHETVTLQQIVGYVLTAGGVYFYNSTDKHLKDEKASDLKNDIENAEKAPLAR